MGVNVFLREQRSGNVTFYLDYYHNGKRYREKLTLGSHRKGSNGFKAAKDTANRLAAKKAGELAEGDYNIRVNKTKISLHDYMAEFVKNYAHEDHRKAKAMLSRLLESTKDARLVGVDEMYCQSFADYLTKTLKPETARNYYSIFKRALKQAVRLKLLRSNPALDTRVDTKGHTSNRVSKAVLSKDELRLLYNTQCGNDDIKDAFLLSCTTGITLSEIRTLHVRDIEDGYLNYKRHKTRDRVVVRVSLNQTAEAILDSRMEKGFHDFLFPDLPSNNGVNKTLRYWVERAGIKKHITFYCGRHTFGTNQALGGHNQSAIAQNMGHSSTLHTEKYIRHVDEAKKAASLSADFFN